MSTAVLEKPETVSIESDGRCHLATKDQRERARQGKSWLALCGAYREGLRTGEVRLPSSDPRTCTPCNSIFDRAMMW